LLLGTRAALGPGRDLERRHTLLSVPAIALLCVIIFAAMIRMRLYVHYFGLTVDRLYPMVFMGWLGIVLVWLVVTVLRGNGRMFAAGTAVSGLAVLLALNVVRPTPSWRASMLNVPRVSLQTPWSASTVLTSLG